MRTERCDTQPAMPTTMHDRPLVTMVLVAYCQENIVAEAIQGCFDQTYQPLEIIVSDDCSQDGTWTTIKDLVAKYQGPHKVVTNRNPKNLGIVRHVNKVLQMASGTLIVACAGDDISMPERTERLVKAWMTDSSTIKSISSACQKITWEGEVIGTVSAFRSLSHAAEPSAMQVIRNRAYCLGATMMWHRDVIDHFGEIPQTSHAEDGPLLLRATLIGRACYVDEPLIKHRVGGVSNPTGTTIIDDYFQHSGEICKKRMQTMSAMITDLSRFTSHDVRNLLKVGRRRLKLLEFENELNNLSLVERRASISIAIWKTLNTGQITYILKSLIYAFPGAYLSYRRRRYL